MSFKCHGGQLQVVSACRFPLRQMGTGLPGAAGLSQPQPQPQPRPFTARPAPRLQPASLPVVRDRVPSAAAAGASGTQVSDLSPLRQAHVPLRRAHVPPPGALSRSVSSAGAPRPGAGGIVPGEQGHHSVRLGILCGGATSVLGTRGSSCGCRRCCSPRRAAGALHSR